MAEFASDCEVFADADIDAYWLEILAEGANQPVPFAVRYLGEFMVDHNFTRAQVVAALEEAKIRLPKEHLAREDAKRLALVVNLLLKGEGTA
jgi:hypothetical protein